MLIVSVLLFSAAVSGSFAFCGLRVVTLTLSISYYEIFKSSFRDGPIKLDDHFRDLAERNNEERYQYGNSYVFAFKIASS